MATGRVPTTANSPLTAKGDLFGYSTAPARLAVGNDGEQIVADSSTSTGLRYQGNFAAGKNKVINGDFGIWQRGTTFSTSAAYTSDRWELIFDGAGATRAITQQTFTPGTAPVAGYEGQYFYRYNQSVAGTTGTYNIVRTKLEDVRTFAGQTVTVSFWAKASVTTSMTSVYLTQNFGSGGSGGVDISLVTSPSFTTSWVRYSYTAAVPSITGKTLGTNTCLELRINYPLNSTFTVDIWGVQMEAGSVATAFQTATGTLQGELAACQRYYYRSTSGVANKWILPMCVSAINGTSAIYAFSLPVTMRTTPSSVDSSTLQLVDGLSGYAVTAITLSADSSPAIAYGTMGVASGITVRYPYSVNSTSASGYIGFSAEL